MEETAMFRWLWMIVLVLTVMGCKQGEEPPGDGDTVETPTIVRMGTLLPSDEKATCPITADELKTWFASGEITANGMVNAADSLNFDDSTDCNFYKWSWQMFLWLTSPTNEPGNPIVFDSNPFFDVQVDGRGRKLVSEKDINVRGGKQDVPGTGQAGETSYVLEVRSFGPIEESLVFYAVHVNDVFAYMVSGVNSGDLNLTDFPTTAEELQTIVDYAQNTYGADISDQKSLAMEFKTSWVVVREGMNAENYVTIAAEIPVYTEESDTKWVWDGTTMKDVTLALVGFHVVGSAKDHPEMIWATFDHAANAPNQAFVYTNAQDEEITYSNFAEDGSPLGDWQLFASTGNKSDANQPRMKEPDTENNTIVAVEGNTIGPSDTFRYHPWGDKDDAANNTEIINLNNTLLALLVDGDLRKNYVLTGAIWTKDGVIPNQMNDPRRTGSKFLANTTMETYTQGDPKVDANVSNCFSCHWTSSDPVVGTNVSHIFSSIEPLPKPN
jgi:hypothetical protein